METLSDYTTVSARIVTSPHSKLRRLEQLATGVPLMYRIWQRRAVLLSVVIVLLTCYAILCIKATREFDATSQVTLPMMIADGSGQLPVALNPGSLAERAADELPNVKGSHDQFKLSLLVDPVTNTLHIRASAADATTAVNLANAAASIVVGEDRALWLKSLASASGGTATASKPFAQILAPADIRDSDTAPQMELHWNSSLAKSDAPWAVALALLACGLALLTPTPQFAKRTRQGVFHFAASDSPPLAPQTELPTLASVLLTPDLTSEYASLLRPIITEVNPALMVWLTGHLSGVYERSLSDAKLAYAREFLITRGMENSMGGRGTALAIGRALASRGVSTILLDMDLASNPSQREELGISEEIPGIWEMLTENYPLDDCLLEDDSYPCLYALSAGRGRAGSTQEADVVIDSVEFLDLLDAVGSIAKVVLIHGPAVSAGALTIAKRVDATLLTVDKTPGDIAVEADHYAAAALRDVQANIIGVVEIAHERAAFAVGR